MELLITKKYKTYPHNYDKTLRYFQICLDTDFYFVRIGSNLILLLF